MDAFMAQQGMCMVCYQKHSSSTLDQIQYIQQVINSYGINPYDEPHNYIFSWFIHEHCHYGIYCSDLEDINYRANSIARDIEPYLIAIAKSDNQDHYNEILDLLRGEFASIYHVMEIIRYENNNNS